MVSERSERDTYRGKNEKIGDVCWRASVASETVLEVKIGYMLFSEASEASGADSLMSSRYIYIFRSRNCFCSCVGVRVYPSPTRLRGPGNLLSNILFYLPAVRSSDAQ